MPSNPVPSRLTNFLETALASPWILLPAIWLAFFWLLGDTALYDLDEGAFAEATREMLERGDFIAIWLNGEPRYDKPILIYWLQSASVLLFGLDEWSLRLPSALAASLWAGAIFAFSRRFQGRETAVVATLLLSFGLIVLTVARSCTADAVLNLWLTLAFFDIYRYHQDPARGTLMRVWLWFALGLLTKGPVALLLPFLVSLVFFLSSGRWRDWLRAVFSPWGWLLFLGLTLPWIVAVSRVPDYHFFQGFLLEHNLSRYADTMEGHGGNVFYFVIAAPLILMPFSGWLVRILGRFREDLRDSLCRYLWIWFLVVFVIFSFSSTQLPHYLLYGTPPLLLLMARHRQLLTSRWLAFLPPLAFLLVLVFIPDAVDFAADRVGKTHLREMFSTVYESFGIGYRFWMATTLLAVLALGLWRSLAPWRGLLIAGLATTLALNGVFRPAFFDLYQQPVKNAGLMAREQGRSTVSFATTFPSFSVYRNAVVPNRAPRSGELVFLRADRLPRLQKLLPGVETTMLYDSGGIKLIEIPQP
jgi:4-amino-4-deoxy-L-arabinose transferase-like glycosyltransferase